MLIASAVILGTVVALWAFSRIGVMLIERASPPIGQMVEVAGLRIHVADIAAAEGVPPAPPLLLIHGASGNLREPLAALSDTLGGRFRIIAVDRPGQGYSSPGDEAMSDPARQADVIAALLEHLAAPPVIAFGHSWGGPVAGALAIRHPQRVAGLLFLSPASHPWPGAISSRSRFFARRLLGRVIAELAVVPLGLVMARPAIALVFAPDPVPPDYGGRIGALLAIRPSSFVANARDVAELKGNLVRLSAHYDEIAVPTEILTGDRDPIVSPAIHSYGLARDIPGARLTILPGAGHMPHWWHTAEVVAAIERLAAAARPAALAAE